MPDRTAAASLAPAAATRIARPASQCGSATTSRTLIPKRADESATETVHVVLPNDANPLGFILGGTVMHLIDMAGAIACHRHTRSLLVTAAVDDLQFLNSIKIGDLIILRARVTCVFTTSLEVQVDVFSEEILTGVRQQTSRAFLTFVSVNGEGGRLPVPPLIVETDQERRVCEQAHARRAERLKRKAGATNSL
ncbi:MAG TPA: acyl-CoA thioesterase [Vicinamibacterales bacterium]